MRQGTVQAQSTDRVNKGPDFFHSFNLRARALSLFSPCSLSSLRLWSLQWMSLNTPSRRYLAALQSGEPAKARHRPSWFCTTLWPLLPNVQPVGRSVKWLVRATAAQAGTLSAGPGWPCFQWLPQRWVASPFIPFFWLQVPPRLHLCLCSQSRAPEGGV